MGINSLLQQDMQGAGLAGIDRLAGNAMFPQSQMDKTQYSVSSQMPTSAEVMKSDYEPMVSPYTGTPTSAFASGGLASIPRFSGDEGSSVEDPAIANDPRYTNPDLQNINLDLEQAQALNALKETDPAQYNSQLISALGDSLKFAYNTNQNYEPIWKQFQSLQEADPAQWHKQQLDWLGHQQGWQVGQNTAERNDAGLPVIQDEIEQAKKAGVSQEEIDSILSGSSQKANAENQQRIINEAQAGHGPLGMTTSDYATIAAILGSGAAAAYLAPAAGASGAASSGGFGLNAAGTGATFGSLSAPVAGSTYGGISAGALGTGVPASLMVPTTGALAGGSAAVGSGITAKQAMAAQQGLKLLQSGTGGGGQQSSGYAAPTASAPTAMPSVNRFGVTGYEGQVPTAEVPLRPISLSKIKGVGGDYTFAEGGIAQLGSYSDGGHLLKGPGDGMSDHIPATIGGSQPARLADGEFVVPADVVSHLGNGSTDAGAKQLYSMMDKIRKARTGTKKQGKQIKPSKFLPKG